MKSKYCPQCRVESQSDADWCWHCGYSYEDAERREAPAADESIETDSNDGNFPASTPK
jgi:uncharacterized membrane protein YvbJ